MAANINIIREQIKSELETLNELAHVIAGYDGKIPQIEIDIMLEKLRTLYADFTTLNKLNSYQHHFEKLHQAQASEQPSVHVPAVAHAAAVAETQGEVKPAVKEPELVEVIAPEPVHEFVPQAEIPVVEVVEEPKAESAFLAENSLAEVGAIEQLNEVPETIENPEPVVMTEEIAAKEESVVAMEEPGAIEPEAQTFPEALKNEILAEAALDFPTEPETASVPVSVPRAAADIISEPLVELEGAAIHIEPINPAPAADESAGKPSKLRKEKSGRDSQKSMNTVLDLFGESAPTLADKMKAESTSVNDSVSRKEDKSVATRMQHSAIPDLKKAIGINEKFLFINELFHGNMGDYTQAIEYLNSQCENLVEAKKYLGSLEEDYKWDRNKISVSVFEGLIERRFIEA